MSKKILIFIVEGLHDEKELNTIFHTPQFAHYREKYDLAYLPQRKDITTDKLYSEKNILKKLNDVVSDFRRNGANYGYFNNIRVDQIHEVIQIVDLDGAFIPRKSVVRGGTQDFFYEPDQITTLNVDGAVGRNKKKAAILTKLLSVSQVGNIPFSIYYVSRDMDHVLFNKPNASKDDKRHDEESFSRLCNENPEIIDKTIFAEGIGAEGTYEESWLFIKEQCNSLKRHTNINLFFGDMAKNKK